MKHGAPGSAGSEAKIFFRWAGILFGVYCLLTILVLLEISERLDRRLLAWAVSLQDPRWNVFFLDATALGSYAVLALLTACGVLVLFLSGERRGAVCLILCSAGASFLSTAFKGLFSRARPGEASPLVEVTSSSYPSGHALAAAAFYLLLAFLGSSPLAEKKRFLLAAALALVALVGFSRAYLGVHYPSDILGGFLLGSAWACLLAGYWFGSAASGGPKAPASRQRG